MAATSRFAIPVTVLMLAAGCSGSSSVTTGDSGGTSLDTTTSSTVDHFEESAFESVLRGIDDGQVPVDVALQAFVLAFGPLPGVEVPSGPVGTIRSGSGPLRWVRANWDRLTTEQQVAVQQYEGTIEVVGSSLLAMPAFFGGTAQVDSVALLGLIEQVTAKIEAESGLTLTAEIELVIAPEAVLSADPAALAWVTPFGTGGPWSGDLTLCRITIGKAGISIAEQVDELGVAGEELTALIAHEVFHCFDDDYSTIEDAMLRPAWVAEGLAEWVGLTVGAETSTSPEVGAWWFRWFSLPEASLFDRAYDAVGFFAHVDATGTHMWSTIGPVLAAASNGNAAAYGAATAGSSPVFLDTWAPGLIRDQTRAPEWETEGPSLPLSARTTPADRGVLGNGGEHLEGAAAYAAAVWRMDLQAEVVVVHGDGPGMVLLSDGASAARGGTIGRPLCTVPGGCSCPEGTPGAAAVFRIVPKGEMIVAVTGGPTDNAAGLTGYSLEDFCQRETCPVGSWVSVRWEVPGIDTAYGAGTMILRVDDLGNGAVEFDPDYPLYAIAEQPGAVEVRMNFSGSYQFNLGLPFGPAQLTGGDAQVTAFANLGGEWVQTAPPIDLVSDSLGSIDSGTFSCEGDQMVITSPLGGRIIFLSWP